MVLVSKESSNWCRLVVAQMDNRYISFWSHKSDGCLTNNRLALLSFVLACGALALSACGKSKEEKYDEALDNAQDELAASSYQSEFGSFGCTEDCSGHDAGFKWAAENGITEPGECGGNSQSFVEGCEGYAQKLQEKVQNGY